MNVTWTWHHAANGCVAHLSPSLPLNVSLSQAVNTNVLNLCSCVFFPFIIVFLQGPYFCFVQQNKAVWKRQEIRCVKPMLKVNHACQFCGVNNSMTASWILSWLCLKALIIFDKQMRRKYKKPQLKTVINMKTVFWSIFILSVFCCSSMRTF